MQFQVVADSVEKLGGEIVIARHQGCNFDRLLLLMPATGFRSLLVSLIQLFLPHAGALTP